MLSIKVFLRDCNIIDIRIILLLLCFAFINPSYMFVRYKLFAV